MSTAVGRRGRGKSRRSLELIEASLFTIEIIDSMSKNETNRVSRQLTDAREAGVIPWAWIVDETRAPEAVPSWRDPAEILRVAAQQYRKDRWALQPQRVEVWSEKGTVRGTLRPVLEEYGVTFRVMHGYASSTALYEVAEDTRRSSRTLTALYVGDYDPSGLHMSEVDLPVRLLQYGASVLVRRIALVADDTESLPSFDLNTKRGDSRAEWYEREYDEDRCWELDALPPPILRERVAHEIEHAIGNRAAWKRCARAEAVERESLVEVLDHWNAGRTEAGA